MAPPFSLPSSVLPASLFTWTPPATNIVTFYHPRSMCRLRNNLVKKKATKCQISLSTVDIFLQFLPSLITFKKDYCCPDFVSVTYGQGSLAKPFHHFLKLYGHCIISNIFFPDNGKCVLSKNLSLTFCFSSSGFSFNCL